MAGELVDTGPEGALLRAVHAQPLTGIGFVILAARGALRRRTGAA